MVKIRAVAVQYGINKKTAGRLYLGWYAQQ